MARSLGLTAYRALARRGEVVPGVPVASRPRGELLWIHAAERDNLLAIQDLAARVCAVREDLNVLITLPKGSTVRRGTQTTMSGVILLENVPDEHPAAVEDFMDHWQPDCCVWTWGDLRPNLILEAADRHVPLFLIDADPAGLDGLRDRWMPDLTRDLLGEFATVLTRSESGAKRLLQLGLTSDDIEITPPLQAGGQALPCSDEDVNALSAALVGRPVWFANAVQPEELSVVLAAHRRALRLAHRLLLILMPADELKAEAVMAQAREEEFRAQDWAEGGELDESIQILVADDPADRGLFYRVAPISFLGSSLIAGKAGCDPFEPAALGSAVLYGPKVGQYLPSYTRLANAGAARIVNDAAALGIAISRLVAPDQAATMAHGGWEVTSQGAALTDKVIDLIQDALDLRVVTR